MNDRFRGRRERGGVVFSFVCFLVVVVACVALYLARRPILRFAGEEWIVDDAIEHADAIVVLSDDNFYADRATRAAELFREGDAPLVVASGRRLRPNATISELMEHDLVERGVPREKILRFPHDGDSTAEEALALVKLAAQKRWRSVIVVTSNYHSRRARYVFHRIFGSSCAVRVASARDADFDPSHWFEKRKSIKQFTREVVGMVVAIWELRGRTEEGGKSQAMVGLARRELPDAV